MSGIEVAGLVLGVLPLLIEAVKGFSTLSDSLHTFRHWSREVDRISVKMKVHNGIFLNECRLLLRLVEDERNADNMLDDEGDGRWRSKALNDKLNSILKDNLEICCSIIKETQASIDDLKKEVEKFDVLQQAREKNEKLKSAIKRLRGAISVTFDKSKYEKSLASLRDSNSDLSALRAQIQQTSQTTNALVKHKPLPNRFQSIQNSSLKLHEALCSAWCCDDSTHRSHYAKLCISAEVQTEVRLDLAISCHETANDTDNCVTREPPIWLYVQSMSMTGNQCVATTTQQITDPDLPMLIEASTSSSTRPLKKKASSDLASASSTTSKKKKSKRVHFFDVSTTPTTIEVAPLAIPPPTLPEFNLCRTKSICHYLKQNYRTCDTSPTRTFFGYLETPQLYKHMFFARNTTSRAMEPTTIYSIFDIMRASDADDLLDVEDQLRLAHKTALAILQFNDTPWLAERWRLAQMSYFGSRHKFDETALKTLHLSSQISSPSLSSSNLLTANANAITNMVPMDGVETTQPIISDEIRYGINNLPLFFLGVALLEIAHWTPLENKMIARDANDQVYAARRLAAGRAPLGPEYQRVVNRCLQCNFGFGTKLASRGLQTAVYNDVVCELEGMIERLTV